MGEKTYLVRLKLPDSSIFAVVASSAAIHGEHLVLLNSKGQLAALFMMDAIKFWYELPCPMSDA